MGLHPVILLIAAAIVLLGLFLATVLHLPPIGVAAVLLALLLVLAVRVAKQWQKAVVLRLGRYRGLEGPGIFVIIPIVDSIPYWMDVRTITTPFNAEQTLTRDSVPVDVDAVLFWRVVDAEKAALEVENYRQAVAWAAQTALRDVIGNTDLAEMLTGRQHIDDLLRDIIGERTSTWGLNVVTVELRDVQIPSGLQDAMSMRAQAERERQARVILGESEQQVAHAFAEAAVSYAQNPIALHLRAMNILLEGMRQNSTIVIVPSSAVETMGLGATAGFTALAKEFAPPLVRETVTGVPATE